MPLTVDPRALYSSLSGELMPEKFEKYILLLLVSILLTIIPFNTGKTPVYCKLIPNNSSTGNGTRNDKPYSSSIELAVAVKGIDKGDKKDCYSRNEKNSNDLLDSNQPDRSEQSSTNIAEKDDVTERMDKSDTAGKICCFVRSAISTICSFFSDPRQSSQNNATSTSTTTTQHPDPIDEHAIRKSKESKEDMEIAEKACSGIRARGHMMWLGWCLSITVVCIAAHDLWINISENEIMELKGIIEKNKEMKICNGCMKRLFMQELTGLCQKCKDVRIRDDAASLREHFLRNQPRLRFLQRHYDIQNRVNLCVVPFAPLICYWRLAPDYNSWFNCDVELPRHLSASLEVQKLSFECYDASTDIIKGTMSIVFPSVLLLLCILLWKVVSKDSPYFKVFAALQNKSTD